jgi:hypothetical protein
VHAVSERAADLKSFKNLGRRLPSLAVWAAGLAAALLFFAWIVAGSESFQARLAGDNDDLDDTSYLKTAAADIETPTALECVGDFLDQNESTILAPVAIALMFFGFGIWSSGIRLQRTAAAFTRATEEASRLRLRPQVGIAAIATAAAETDHRRNAAENSILITVKNFGMTAAHQVWIAAQVAAEPPSGRAPDTRDTGASFTLFSGQSVAIPLAPAEALPATAQSAYVIGHVRYQDQHGQKWRTNFCWAGQSGHATTPLFAPYGSHNEEIAET